MDTRKPSEIERSQASYQQLVKLEKMKQDFYNKDSKELEDYQCGDNYSVTLLKGTGK